jgi:hypothetical protein
MSQRPENFVSPLVLRSRTALLGALALLLVGCSSNLQVQGPAPYDSDDYSSVKSTNTALFDPSAGVIPLPNLLLTGGTTSVAFNTTVPVAGQLNVNPGVPLSPDKAAAYISVKEVGGTNAVTAINAPIYIRFAAPVLASSITPATVKVFQIITDSNGLTEVGPLGFRDMSALFTKEMLSATELQLNPMIPMQPGSRFVYVVTDGVMDQASGKPVGQALTFSFLKYVKGADTNPNATSSNPGTNLAATAAVDPQNPALLIGAASQASLQSIYGNVIQSGAIVISGYGKTMDDLVASAAADASGKAASGAGPTGIGTAGENLYQRRGHIKLMGRFITTAAGAIVPDPLASTNVRAPVETSLWAWANNATLPLSATPAVAMNFSASNGESRVWSNAASLPPATIFSGSAAVNAFYANAGISSVPHAAVGLVALGSYESGDLNLDPAIVASTAGKPISGDLTGTANIYKPGSGGGAVPGTGILQASRNATGQLRGYFHVTRTVPFMFLAPITAAPPAGYPVVIFQHGIGGNKEQMVAMANAACSAGYAVIAIDLPLHGALANDRPAAEWASNFISLPSNLNTRTNMQQAGFNLWRLERILLQPSIDPSGFQAKIAAAGKPISPSPADRRYVSISLGSIVGSYFLAGNSSQTGGSNMKAFFSVPGGRLAYLLRDSPTFAPTINAGLAASGVIQGTPTYNQFFTLVQNVTDSTDPAYMTFPISAVAPSRLSGRVTVQEAIGDTVIPNSSTRYFVNSLAGRGILGSAYDTAPNFAQVRLAGTTNPTVSFLLGPGGLKPSVAPATATSAGPTEGIFQFGSPATAATHGMLLDGSANTALVQRQMVVWLLTGKVIDPADTGSGFPVAPTDMNEESAAAMQKLATPVYGPMHFPKPIED